MQNNDTNQPTPSDEQRDAGVQAAPTEQITAQDAPATAPSSRRRLPWQRNRAVAAGATSAAGPVGPGKGRATVLVAAVAGLLIGGLGGFGLAHAGGGGHHGMRSAEGGYSAGGHGHGMRGMGGHRGMGGERSGAQGGQAGQSGQSADGGAAAGGAPGAGSADNSASDGSGSNNAAPSNTAQDNG